ncbi:hypothetical protein M405DRAFT_79649 [Rhizopogon salebrosus TDB-379]|nr:hypothetical protein M405DRAFT_79649 [Rhizopogon salebrosus TDB-379]
MQSMIGERAVMVKGAELFLRRRLLGATTCPLQCYHECDIMTRYVSMLAEGHTCERGDTRYGGPPLTPQRSMVVRHYGRSPPDFYRHRAIHIIEFASPRTADEDNGSFSTATSSGRQRGNGEQEKSRTREVYIQVQSIMYRMRLPILQSKTVLRCTGDRVAVFFSARLSMTSAWQ